MAIFRGIGGAGDSTTDATVTAVTEQATNAANSATAAANSASSASSSATAAAGSASTASGHATTALGHANDASGYADDASGFADDASGFADDAAASYDAFDDRYLGDKASDPTLDNDGNALLTGALYFNTTDGVMKVYDGSAWLAAFASLSGALIATNNLSDLDNVTSARTNLGLGTAATTASTDYATAAQGALADSALQSETNDLSAAVTWANVPDGNITESSVTQHEAALTITESQISDLGTYAVVNVYTTTCEGSDASGGGDWVQDTIDNPYIATLTVSGLLSTDTPIVDIDLSSVAFANIDTVQNDWALVYRVEASASDTLKLYATDEPASEFSLTIKVVR